MQAAPAITVFCLCLHALFYPLGAAAETVKSETFDLKNGLRVVVVPRPGVPAVAHMIWYKTGAAAEREGKSGLAHLLEHLTFQSTEHLAGGELSDLLASYGAIENATTTQDHTYYYQIVAPERLSLAMLLEAERMRGLQISESELEKEKSVVLEERRMNIDNDPMALLTVAAKKALFGHRPYNKPVIGWEEDVRGLSLKDAMDFYHRHYAPANAVLVVAGNVTAKEVRSLAETYYGHLAGPPAPAETARHSALTPGGRTVTLTDRRARKHEWMRQYLVPAIGRDPERQAFPLLVLAYALGNGDTGRLYKSLVVEQALATSAAIHYDEMYADDTAFSIYVTPRDGVDFHAVEATVDKEIARISDAGVSAEELARAQKALRARAIYAQDSLRNTAMLYGRAHALGANGSYVERWADGIQAVAPEQVRQAARRIFGATGHYVTGTLAPEPGERP